MKNHMQIQSKQVVKKKFNPFLINFFSLLKILKDHLKFELRSGDPL